MLRVGGSSSWPGFVVHFSLSWEVLLCSMCTCLHVNQKMFIIGFMSWEACLEKSACFCVCVLNSFPHLYPQLSPKKTWEGFIGGFFATVVFGILVSSWTGFFCKEDLFAGIVFVVRYQASEARRGSFLRRTVFIALWSSDFTSWRQC